MKVRNKFVSNSSSSSFIIKKTILNKDQINAIRHHIHYAQDHQLNCGHCDPNDAWNIIENKEFIGGHTSMANFNFGQFLKVIGVNLQYVEIDGQYDFDVYFRLTEIEEEQQK